MENKLNNVANNEFQSMAKVSPLEMILNNPGFVHLAENIFGNLDCEKLEVCEQINESSKQILENAMFWIRKFEGLSKKNHEDWIKVIQSKKNSDKEKFISAYLKWKLKKDNMADLPCYTEMTANMHVQFCPIWRTFWPMCHSPTVQDDFRKKIRESISHGLGSYEDTEIVKILAPLTDNPNGPDKWGRTPIYESTINGHTEIVKILARSFCLGPI